MKDQSFPQRLSISYGTSFHASGTREIPLDIWTSLVKRDPSLEAMDAIKARDPATGQEFTIPCPNGARWNDHPEDVSVLLTYHDDHLELSCADEPTQRKAAEIAAKFGASVHIEEMG